MNSISMGTLIILITLMLLTACSNVVTKQNHNELPSQSLILKTYLDMTNERNSRIYNMAVFEAADSSTIIVSQKNVFMLFCFKKNYVELKIGDSTRITLGKYSKNMSRKVLGMLPIQKINLSFDDSLTLNVDLTRNGNVFYSNDLIFTKNKLYRKISD